jgi:hypothetical protein
MNSGTGPQSAGAGPNRVLLIGQADKALSDIRNMDRRVFEMPGNVLDGIDAAARHQFESVVVVMEGLANQLHAILKALRKSTNAKLVLLARMHEEPTAQRLTAPSAGESKLADEYSSARRIWRVSIPAARAKGSWKRRLSRRRPPFSRPLSRLPPRIARPSCSGASSSSNGWRPRTI